jgi:hypothetical protein
MGFLTRQWHCTCIFEKLAVSLIPRLTALLKRLMSRHADNDGARAEIILRFARCRASLSRGLILF